MWGEHFAAESVAVCRKAPRKFKNQQSSTRLVLCEERRASIVWAISFDRNKNLCVLISCAFGSQLACISSQKMQWWVYTINASLVVHTSYMSLEPMDIRSRYM